MNILGVQPRDAQMIRGSKHGGSMTQNVYTLCVLLISGSMHVEPDSA